MEEAESLDDSRREVRLLGVLDESIRVVEGVRRLREHRYGVTGKRRGKTAEAGRGDGGGTQEGSKEGVSADGEEEEEERGAGADEEEECVRNVLRTLRELSISHSDRVTSWRRALRECARILTECPPGGSKQQPPSTTGTERLRCSDSTHIFISIEEDIQNILDNLSGITTKLDKEILNLHAEEASTVEAGLQETAGQKASEVTEEDTNHPNSHSPLEFDSRPKEGIEHADGGSHAMLYKPNTEKASRFSSSECDDVERKRKELVDDSEGCDDDVSQDSQRDSVETVEQEKGKETKTELITVGLAGSDVPDACFIRAPPGVADVLQCEVANALSCLMVSGSEELVSRVIRVKIKDGSHLHFPVNVVVPFCGSYRGSYRDVAVKIVDKEGRTSYLTPITTEGTYGGQWGSFAEVRVYSLGLFAVISCLKRENYSVPTKGLSLKLTMDPRICLNYLPGSFRSPVMAQTMIQPMDAALLATVKSRSDAYHSVVSTSPVLHLTHPSSQPLRRPLSLTLPCPPNPEKKKHIRVQEEPAEHQPQLANASPMCDQHASCRRTLVSPVKSKVISDEQLTVLGSRAKQWSVLDDVTGRNLQKGLVTFELTENFDRLLVVRLLSPLQPCHLTSLAEELEESVCRHAVTVVLQRRRDEPNAVLVVALPSRDLRWELSKLQARGYGGLPEASSEISMREGDQLLLRFSGNITSKGAQSDRGDETEYRLTFHTQLHSRLLLHLTEVDPFGNYSSPHYKGTANFYKVTRDRLEWRGDRPRQVDAEHLGEPVCKLSLTLPKRVRTVNQPNMARVKLCEEKDYLSDSLLLWLSGELSEEEVASLAVSLRLRRSAAQLVKLRAGDSPSAQAFHVLATWRRGLPAALHQPKASQLARCLAKSGRPDLARELLLRQADATRQKSLQTGNLKSNKTY